MEEVRLRRLRLADISELTRLANNRRIWDNVKDYFPHPYLEKDAEFFIRSKASEDPQITFAIEYHGSLVGVVGLEPQSDVYAHTCEIGYWLGEEFWGKGIATYAVMLATDYAFQTLAMYRIYAGVFEHNEASMKVLEKAGFVKEATLKGAIKKNAVIINEELYSIVRVD